MSGDLIERRFLLLKRGLYYGPDNCGYTGFKERAGRYLESDAYPDGGVTAIHEDEADEIAPNCFDDLARGWMQSKLAEARAEISSLRAEGEGDEHYTVAMDRRPKDIGGVRVGPGLYRIHWKSGGSSLAAIGMCANGAWWVAPTNWVSPAVAFRIDEDPEGRWSWACVEALERIDPSHPVPDADVIGRLVGALAKRTFLTCVSGDGPTPHLKIHFASLADAHASHDALIAVKKEPTDAL